MDKNISIDNVYREYSNMVYKYLLSKTGSEDIAEELTQETFYQAVKNADKFDCSSKVSTWLCAIAKNKLYEYRRKHLKTNELNENTEIPITIEEQYISDEARLEILISNNPIDKKYLDIQNNTPLFDATKEGKNYIDWAEAYEKQYKIICKAILDYAESNPDAFKFWSSKVLTEAVGNIEDYSKYNDIMADLYYLCIGAKYGPGGGTLMRNRIYLNEARTKTLRLAELAYFLDADFEWVE